MAEAALHSRTCHGGCVGKYLGAMHYRILVFTACAFALATASFAAESVLMLTASTPPNRVDLTMEGAMDWAHWGRVAGTTILHRKNTPRSRIGELVKLGQREVHTYENNPTIFAWSNGAPTTEVKQTRSGVFIYGQNAGFQLAVPAETTLRVAKLFCGVWRGQGRLEATLSDGGATASALKEGVETDGDNVCYTVRYRAATAGQTLTLQWTNAGNKGNVTLQAVTMSDAE